MRNAISSVEAPDAKLIEEVLVGGDLSKLTPTMRISYYNRVCESLGLNPLTRPFEYITLSGKLTLYAKKDATEQLRLIHRVSITELSTQQIGDVFVTTAKASNAEGRTDAATGAVSIAGLKGEALANAIMKSETKSKRRVTLSICGLGLLDETEVAASDEPVPQPVMVVNTRTGEIVTEKLTPPAQAAVDAGQGDMLLISVPQRTRLWATAKDAGWKKDEVKAWLLKEYHIDSSSKIPRAKYDEMIARLQGDDDKPEAT